MSHLAVRVARLWYGLPYYYAQMHYERVGASLSYHSTRCHRQAAPAAFNACYRPTGPVYQATHGTLDHWLTERYCLYIYRIGEAASATETSTMPHGRYSPLKPRCRGTP